MEIAKIAKFTKMFGRNPRKKPTQVWSKKRLAITLSLPRKIYS